MVVGGIGALGGYVVSPDTVEGVTESEQTSVWDTAKEVLAIMGTIQEEQRETGTILAKIAGTKVTVTIASITVNTSKVRVRARKGFLPRISTAQDVFVKIMSQLTGWLNGPLKGMVDPWPVDSLKNVTQGNF